MIIIISMVSGSCYKCLKNAYGLKGSYTQGILEDIIDKANLSNINVEVMPENTNWDGLTR